MKRTSKKFLSTAIILGFFLTGCSTYTGADGNTHVSDARVCDTGVCDFLVIAAMAAVGVAVAAH